MEENELQEILIDTQKEYTRSNKFKDKIIVILIVLMFLEAVIGYCGFVWYESQFDYVTTEQTTETKSVDVGTNTLICIIKSFQCDKWKYQGLSRLIGVDTQQMM